MKKAAISIILILLIAILAAPFIIYGILYYSMPDRLNILIVGTDQREEERSRSDVLMVFSFPKSPKKQASIITIPRDSKVEIPEYGMDKITHAYVYGEAPDDGKTLGNIDLTKETVENLLDIKLHGSLEFNFESFKDIVDMVGGVWTEDGYYDGDKALALVRNRYREGGDFARTSDQRDIVKAVLTKMKDRETAIEVYNYMIESEKARIDINKTQALIFGGVSFIRRMGKLSLGDLNNEFIPGEGGYHYSEKFGQDLYFWIINEEEMKKLVDEKLR